MVCRWLLFKYSITAVSTPVFWILCRWISPSIGGSIRGSPVESDKKSDDNCSPQFRWRVRVPTFPPKPTRSEDRDIDDEFYKICAILIELLSLIGIVLIRLRPWLTVRGGDGSTTTARSTAPPIALSVG